MPKFEPVHGDGDQVRVPEYRTWSSILRRCLNPRQAAYKDYGAKGVTVAAEWRGPGGYERFLAHVGRRPSPAHTIDRKDSARGYEPGNVRWATMKEQQNNRRNNRRITAGGETLTLQAWAERLGCSHTSILGRIRRGMSEEEAVTRPISATRQAPQKRRARLKQGAGESTSGV